MSFPIPRRLLQHVAVLTPLAGVGRNGPTYGAEVILRFVRVESLRQVLPSPQGDAKADRARLIYDPVSSVPPGLSLKPKDRLTFEGETYTIRQAVPVRARGPIHHWEASLE